MAATNQKSPIVTAQEAKQDVSAYNQYANVRLANIGVFVQSGDGDAESTVILAKMPPGRVSILLGSSYLHVDALGTDRVIDLGHNGYTGLDGVAVAAAPAAWNNNTASASALNATPGVNANDNGRIITIMSTSGFDIILTVQGGTIPDTSEITGYFLWAKW